MKVTITYKNGNTLTEKVNYAHIAGGNLVYTVKKSPAPVFQEPVKISLDNIADLDISEE